MINIKKMSIMIFLIFIFINISDAFTIYENENVKIGSNIFINENKNCTFIVSNISDIPETDLGILNTVFFGTLKINSYVLNYFSFGLNFRNNIQNFSFKQIQYNNMNPFMIGLYIKKIGFIEYGKNYNLIYDLYNLNSKNFDNIFTSNLVNMNNYLNFKINNSIIYKTNDFFGFIKNFCLSVQYHYKNNNILNFCNEDNLINSITYNIKKYKIKICSAYSLNLYDILYHFHIKNNYNEIYFCSIKYNSHKLFLSSLYNEINYINKFNTQDIVNYHINNFKFFIQYQLQDNLYFAIEYLNTYKINIINKSNFNILYQLNMSLKYFYSKNIIMYYIYNINLFKSDNTKDLDFKHLMNVINIGIIYCF